MNDREKPFVESKEARSFEDILNRVLPEMPVSALAPAKESRGETGEKTGLIAEIEQKHEIGLNEKQWSELTVADLKVIAKKQLDEAALFKLIADEFSDALEYQVREGRKIGSTKSNPRQQGWGSTAQAKVSFSEGETNLFKRRDGSDLTTKDRATLVRLCEQMVSPVTSTWVTFTPTRLSGGPRSFYDRARVPAMQKVKLFFLLSDVGAQRVIKLRESISAACLAFIGFHKKYIGQMITNKEVTDEEVAALEIRKPIKLLRETYERMTGKSLVVPGKSVRIKSLTSENAALVNEFQAEYRQGLLAAPESFREKLMKLILTLEDAEHKQPDE